MSKITLPLNTILDPRFQKAMEAITALPLSMPVSFRLAQVRKECDAQRDTFTEAKNKRIKELGESDEQGNCEVKDPEKLKILVDELNALVKGAQVMLPIRQKLELNGCNLAAVHVLQLLDILADPNPPEIEEEKP